ncbi:hypothetical protein [Streptomyces sp. NPDC003015]
MSLPRRRPHRQGDRHRQPLARGLRLVENVATTWGVWSRGRHGKTVWALVMAD